MAFSMLNLVHALMRHFLQIGSEHNIITSSKITQTKQTISSECSDQKVVKYESQSITSFDDLPNELLLIVCRYMSSIHVLDAFLNYNNHLFHCIVDYRTYVDLTRCSYNDYQHFLFLLKAEYICPSTLIVSNKMIPTQISIFFKTCISWIMFKTRNIRRLSFLECALSDIAHTIGTNVEYFKYLRSLRIVESMSDETSFGLMDYFTIEALRKIAFSGNFKDLIELELITKRGILLNKQLSPNKHLKQLAISLQTIDDLLILVDGLVPNLTILHVTLSEPSCGQQLMLPCDWPHQSMSCLIDFRLTTNGNATVKLDHLRNVVMPLVQLETFVLNVKEWVSNGDRFIQNNEIERLINEYMPRLRNFQCCIQTTVDIDIQAFADMNRRWRLVCAEMSYSSCKYVYTIPWSFEKLSLSMLANNDTTSVCPNVRILTIDMADTNLFHRFPNIHTLIILPHYELSDPNYNGFRRLRHLTTANIETASPFMPLIHTLTLTGSDKFWEKQVVCSSVRHLILQSTLVSSISIVTSLVKQFHNLYSLKILFTRTEEYFDCLNVLLDRKRLPYLKMLKTNWTENKSIYSDGEVNMWINQKTILKWQSAPFYSHYDCKFLTICP